MASMNTIFVIELVIHILLLQAEARAEDAERNNARLNMTISTLESMSCNKTSYIIIYQYSKMTSRLLKINMKRLRKNWKKLWQN